MIWISAMKLPENQHLFTVKEVGDFMFGEQKKDQTNMRKIYRLIKAGFIDCIKDGKRRYITRKAIFKFLGEDE